MLGWMLQWYAKVPAVLKDTAELVAPEAIGPVSHAPVSEVDVWVIEPELYSWDLAAPSIIVEEAGGRVTDLEGRRTYTGGNALASNGLLHDAILKRLNHA